MSDQAWHLRKLVSEHLKREGIVKRQTDGLLRVISIVSLEADCGASAVAQAWAMFLTEKGYRTCLVQPKLGSYQLQRAGDASKIMRWNFQAHTEMNVAQWEAWSSDYDFVVINSASHPLASPQPWIDFSDTLVMVTPFQKEAAVKSYSWLKYLAGQQARFELFFLLNEVKEMESANHTYLKLVENIKKFLAIPVMQGGLIPFDPYFQKEELHDKLESTLYPLPRGARALKIVADRWAQHYSSPLFLNQPFYQRMTKLHHYLKSVKNDLSQTRQVSH